MCEWREKNQKSRIRLDTDQKKSTTVQNVTRKKNPFEKKNYNNEYKNADLIVWHRNENPGFRLLSTPPPPPEKSRYQKYLTKKKSPQSVLGPKCTNFKPHAKRSYIPVITNTPPSTPPPPPEDRSQFAF